MTSESLNWFEKITGVKVDVISHHLHHNLVISCNVSDAFAWCFSIEFRWVW